MCSTVPPFDTDRRHVAGPAFARRTFDVWSSASLRRRERSDFQVEGSPKTMLIERFGEIRAPVAAAERWRRGDTIIINEL